MNKNITKIISSIFNLCLYASAGLAAPFIFRNIADRKLAGFIAGGYFAFVALRAVKLSLIRPYHKILKFYFITYLVLLVLFWVWRFLDPRMLGEIIILGVNAYWLHHMFTGLFFVSFLLLVFGEINWFFRKRLTL